MQLHMIKKNKKKVRKNRTRIKGRRKSSSSIRPPLWN